MNNFRQAHRRQPALDARAHITRHVRELRRAPVAPRRQKKHGWREFRRAHRDWYSRNTPYQTGNLQPSYLRACPLISTDTAIWNNVARDDWNALTAQQKKGYHNNRNRLDTSQEPPLATNGFTLPPRAATHAPIVQGPAVAVVMQVVIPAAPGLPPAAPPLLPPAIPPVSPREGTIPPANPPIEDDGQQSHANGAIEDEGIDGLDPEDGEPPGGGPLPVEDVAPPNPPSGVGASRQATPPPIYDDPSDIVQPPSPPAGQNRHPWNWDDPGDQTVPGVGSGVPVESIPPGEDNSFETDLHGPPSTRVTRERVRFLGEGATCAVSAWIAYDTTTKNIVERMAVKHMEAKEGVWEWPGL